MVCCKKEPSITEEHDDGSQTNDESDSSDVSMTDESDSDEDTAQEDLDESALEEDNITAATEDNDGDEEEEEDEVIQAIRRENERERDHPPTIQCEDFVVDISFHPHEDLLAVASITGDVVLYKYTNNENTVVNTLELHTKACRDVEFGQDGRLLYTVAKDKAIMLSDVNTGKLVKFYEQSHDVPVYCVSVLDEHLFATGDDDGMVKLWDRREAGDRPIFRMKKNEDYISDIITNEGLQYLVCSSGDGSVTTMDLRQRKFLMQSEPYDEEFTSMGLFRTETKLIVSSNTGKLYLYNWREFGLHSDCFPGNKTTAINAIIPITEQIVVTAGEDGNLRATHLFPHRHLGVVGQHTLSVERLDICNTGQFIASSGHENEIKFWNISYFAEYERVTAKKQNKTTKKREQDFNLPSSKRKNVADFFSDL